MFVVPFSMSAQANQFSDFWMFRLKSPLWKCAIIANSTKKATIGKQRDQKATRSESEAVEKRSARKINLPYKPLHPQLYLLLN